MEARRREPFEREPGERVEPRLVETGAAVAPARMDLVRWGPTWAGFFVTLAITALLILLGQAIGLAADGAAAPGAPGGTAMNIWTPISFIIGLAVGGYVMMRLAATGGPLVSVAHGALLWAVSLVLGSLLAALGLSAFGGMMPGAAPGVPGAPPGAVTPGTMWGTLIALIIGLAAAIGGAWLGDRARRPEREVADRTYRAAA